jgi:hypothetical protein
MAPQLDLIDQVRQRQQFRPIQERRTAYALAWLNQPPCFAESDARTMGTLNRTEFTHGQDLR